MKRIEEPLREEELSVNFVRNEAMGRGLVCFVGILGFGILLVLSSVVFPILQDYTMIIVAVMFLAAGISAVLLSGFGLKKSGLTFTNGVVSILPAVLMILMANSIKYTLTEAHVLDTLLHSAVLIAETLPKW